jgi:hypothetical protein
VTSDEQEEEQDNRADIRSCFNLSLVTRHLSLFLKIFVFVVVICQIVFFDDV